ncbi:MAG TPA: VCBS repeat-containing protein [Thermoanaerobaculia bacterium]|nr:VCBS repeat-containing protein [Thermoanaerobaculia bacterium]
MRLAAVSILTLSLASAAFAQLEPGFIVRSGEPFPIVADFNGDGLDDLIQERNVILNDGASLIAQHDLGLPVGEKVVGVLDANGDHRLDLLTAGSVQIFPPQLPQPPLGDGPGYTLYLADASRRYSTAIPISKGHRPYIADVDGDGRHDFLVMVEVPPDGFRSAATDVHVLRSLGDGTFEPLAPFRIAKAVQIVPDHRVLSGDLDGDGLPDLVIRCNEDLVILRGTGGGTFAVDNRYLPMNMEFGWWSARLGDIDGDSNLDIILPAFRGIRVFFGDGHGRFPRTTRAAIAQHRKAELPAGLSDLLDVDHMNQPRNLALGHFTRADQLQIAAGTGEGDIVVFSYERSAVREVSRTRTEYWLLDIRPGDFRSTGVTDLYVMGTLIWGEVYPRPRLFYGAEDFTPVHTPLRLPSRTRAAHRTMPETALRMQMQADCIDAAAERWRFARDGVFGFAQRPDSTIEAVFDGSLIYFRLTAPYAKEAVRGALAETNGSWSGRTDVLTACGWKTMTVTAKRE